MKYIVPVLIVIIIVLVAALSFTLGKKGTLSSGVSSQVSPTVTLAPTATSTPTPINTKKITGGGIYSLYKWELTVPSTWQEKREKDGVNSEKVILTKDSYEISITQGGFGGAACLYPGDADIEGPSARYEAYKEITTKSGDALRRSWTGDEMVSKGFGICHKTQYGWGTPTLYGHIAFITPTSKTKAMLDEMDAVLSSLTKL